MLHAKFKIIGFGLWRRMFVEFRQLSSHLLGASCSYGLPYVLFVFCSIVTLVITHFGFDVETLVQNLAIAYLLLFKVAFSQKFEIHQ